jgi:hypothetical protein
LSEKFFVFIDLGIRISQDWGKEIDRNIKNADGFITFISEESMKSPMVKNEIEKAYRLQKKRGIPIIFPVRLAYKDELPYPVSAYLDPVQQFFWEDDSDTEFLLKELDDIFTSVDRDGPK